MTYSQKQVVRIYKNHVELLREASGCKKNLQENLDNITAERYSSKKVQCYQDLNKDLQHGSNRYLTQKLNVVNNVWSPKNPLNIISHKSTVSSSKNFKLR